MRLLSRSWVIIVRRYVLILLRAEKERLDEVVAGITSNSFMTVQTDENAILAAEERPPRM